MIPPNLIDLVSDENPYIFYLKGARKGWLRANYVERIRLGHYLVPYKLTVFNQKQRFEILLSTHVY